LDIVNVNKQKYRMVKQYFERNAYVNDINMVVERYNIVQRRRGQTTGVLD
jgi:hypothetical protein